MQKIMQDLAKQANDASTLVDLLPVGTLLTQGRAITKSNNLFANIFGYSNEELLGKSLEILYPSYREFVDRGDEWLPFMRRDGGHCDDHFMLRKGGELICVTVKGRCKDRQDPYMLVACTFELTSPVPIKDIHLTWRERAIVEAMSEGMTSKEIARKLELSHRTIETYKARLMAKVGARNASQLLAMIR